MLWEVQLWVHFKSSQLTFFAQVVILNEMKDLLYTNEMLRSTQHDKKRRLKTTRNFSGRLPAIKVC